MVSISAIRTEGTRVVNFDVEQIHKLDGAEIVFEFSLEAYAVLTRSDGNVDGRVLSHKVIQTCLRLNTEGGCVPMARPL